MSNVLANGARELFLDGELSWTGDTFKVVTLDSTYTYDDAHAVLDDVDGGARIWTSDALTGKTVTGGVADANDVITSALGAGDTITQLWVFHDSGDETTSTLVAFYDTDIADGPISLPTNDQPIVIAWNNGPFRLFKI